jgi:hypothetical protein
MATIITHSIGSSSRDYATPALWIADSANSFLNAFGGTSMVTANTAAVGQCYADSEFVSATAIATFNTGYTTSATNNITLTTASGQSFRDNASVRNNALSYNAANGVALRFTGNSGPAISITDGNVSLSGLQIISTGINGTRVIDASGSGPTIVSQCILQYVNNTASAFANLVLGGNVTLNNCLIACAEPNAGSNALQTTGGTTVLNECTCVGASDQPLARFYYNNGGTLTALNCAVFGCGVINQDGSGTFTTCATDLASPSPSTGFTAGLTYANQFVGVTSATLDWREKAGANLQGTGTADSTNGAFDISGLARPQAGRWDIGAWELATSVLWAYRLP